MKKAFLFIAILFSVLQTPSVFAADSSGSATTAPLDESEMKNVKKIIDLVASNSAEQKLTSKTGVIGKVAEKTNTTINLTTLNGSNRIIDIDEITKFEDPDSKTFGISDIKTGEILGVIGVLNKVSNHILGRFVDKLSSLPIYFHGVITDIDRANFQYTAIDENGNKMVLDIQTSSKISSFTRDSGQIKSGFSKGTVGTRVYASGFPDSQNKNQLEVSRMILLTDAPLSPKLQKYASSESSEEETPTRSTAKPTPTPAE